MAPRADVVALTAAYRHQVQIQRDAMAAYIQRLWRSLGTYRDQQMATFATQITPTVAGGQHNVAALTAGYLARHRQLLLGSAGKPAAVDNRMVSGAGPRNGTMPHVVYERPFHLVWRQLAAGATPDAAIQAGLNRAIQSALTDLQLAKTHAARAVLSTDTAVTGLQRLPETEGYCALCVVSSTHSYPRGDLLPIHPVCDCSIAPLYDGDKPLSDPLTSAATSLIKDTFRITDAEAAHPNYGRLVAVHHHGELGPVLAPKGAPFLGPDDL